MSTDDSSPPTPRFRLAIVGGGIAGLSLAVTLGRYADPSSPIQIDMYEAGPEITTVGAGISVWPRTWVIVRELGLYDELASEAVKSNDSSGGDQLKPAFFYRKSDWQREGYDFARVMIPNGSTTMHRAEMVDVLVRHLPQSCSIHTSKRLLNYTEASEDPGTAYTLHFADGTSATADVIIGADGIKSKTRATMYDLAHKAECANPESEATKREDCERCKHATPKWTGIVTYRYLIPSDTLREINPNHRALDTPALLSYSGKHKHIVTYPISHGKFVNFVGFVTDPGAQGTTYPHKWVMDATREELVSQYPGWEREVEEMLRCVDSPTVWAIHVLDSLPFSVRGRVALMGDAVHPMTPHLGSGGGQAIEDAYILGRLLADPRTSRARVEDVFRIYQDIRLPFGLGVVLRSDKVGHLCEFDYPGLYDGAPVSASSQEEEMELTKEKLGGLGRAIEDVWSWQVKERVEDQWNEAKGRYEALFRELTEQPSKSVLQKVTNYWSRECSIM
ncbi:FAD/NAD(P)-binding domain-containing protein [Lentinus tigrinus ALCF2SS1-7]|uniref:FAD/NAD(P)-binding domain-containing protein n=1 Tax=Lentinus tigrinus ALCF2SS1-6 TaxID=1328759 RepID=A0A5C2RUD4_9APHY|nr:FAD/NAD(P)-binding domain-containing protein [Lentinus tigrinus ALCF2SS1-6]RPD68882.1 FAD/NAD(P)-binding domain-containing protein [Lentinus tigrinus ALCF2SS1-7]